MLFSICALSYKNEKIDRLIVLVPASGDVCKRLPSVYNSALLLDRNYASSSVELCLPSSTTTTPRLLCAIVAAGDFSTTSLRADFPSLLAGRRNCSVVCRIVLLVVHLSSRQWPSRCLRHCQPLFGSSDVDNHIFAQESRMPTP